MEREVFEKFRTIIYKESGIVLPPEKISLLSNRIQKRLKALHLKDPRQYLQIIEIDKSGEELSNLVDVVSTNVTHFYREEAHFARLRDILASYKASQKKEIRIWCAAASSGEEPYTILFESLEVIDQSQQTVKILATDICTKVLRQAVEGRYSIESVSKIPANIINKYMQQEHSGFVTVKPEYREKILFKKLNLISTPYPLRGKFDIIFCRNVMIYFDTSTRSKIVNEFSKLLNPDGYLIVSLSESLFGIEQEFAKLNGSVYQKKS